MPLERSTTTTVIRKLKALGIHAEKVGGSLHGKAGRPDIDVLIPAYPFAIPLRIEMKQVGKKVKPLQEKRHRDLLRVRCPVLVASSWEEIEQKIRELRAEWVDFVTLGIVHLETIGEEPRFSDTYPLQTRA